MMGDPNERKDERAVGAGYYISREEVDRWSRALILDWLKENENDDEIVSYIYLYLYIITLTVFVQPSEEEEFTPCEDRWQNMVNDTNEKMQGMYDETGGFMAFCRHGFVLVIIDMVRSGEL